MWHRGKRIAINLALQGGGAHGAFTWGVLDQLLQQESLEFAWISGTSAGAVNAVAMASGLTKGGAKAARATLREVWEAVRRAGVPDLLHVTPFLGLSRSETLRSVTAMMSP
ncbi:MAG: patatin-like phospholipase family protein [Hyphomicrobiaceae bacterium]